MADVDDLQAQIEAEINKSKAESMTDADKVIPMMNQLILPGDIDNEPMADLENMTVWEHVEFWGELVYQFLWQL